MPDEERSFPLGDLIGIDNWHQWRGAPDEQRTRYRRHLREALNRDGRGEWEVEGGISLEPAEEYDRNADTIVRAPSGLAADVARAIAIGTARRVFDEWRKLTPPNGK